MLEKKNYGADILRNIRRLSEVNEQRDIKPLMATSFPGTHCPLMGVLMTVRQLPEAVTVLIGTDECTYYSKLLANMKIFGSLKESCVSVVIDDYDVTFGTIKKTKKAVAEIFETGAPKCIVLVTTCVLEIIGDDYDALVDELEEKYHIPVLLVRTEHFQCRDHLLSSGEFKSIFSLRFFSAKRCSIASLTGWPITAATLFKNSVV
jgi:nitrogenase molybdenum-cofactor synthesis protein NifE